jgi:hypothetical protein
MKYLADYVVSHRGNKHSGCIVLPAECVSRVGDVLDIRIAGNPVSIQIDSVNIRKEMYGIQHATLVCSTYTI